MGAHGKNVQAGVQLQTYSLGVRQTGPYRGPGCVRTRRRIDADLIGDVDGLVGISVDLSRPRGDLGKISADVGPGPSSESVGCAINLPVGSPERIDNRNRGVS